jgi:hypothetical protein
VGISLLVAEPAWMRKVRRGDVLTARHDEREHQSGKKSGRMHFVPIRKGRGLYSSGRVAAKATAAASVGPIWMKPL